MAAIADLSALVNRLTGGNSGTPENIFFFKNTTIAGTVDTWVANAGWYSFWKYDGFPGGGSNPGAAAVPTSATAGALPFTNPGGGRTKWLVQAGVTLGNPANLSVVMMYDRLLHISGLSGTDTGAQTVQSGGSPALTRNTGGVGNQIWVEIYTQVGTTTGRTITASYTNQSGSSGRTTVAVPFGGTANSSSNEDNIMIRLPLQSGDTGVQAVASVTISATTGTAGNFGVTVVRPLCYLSSPGVNGRPPEDFTIGPGGIPSIDTDACLAFMGLPLSATEVAWHGMLATVEA
jgi:hypothetical protein